MEAGQVLVKKIIKEIEPKYLIINAGKNNRYGHPNDSVLENLKYIEQIQMIVLCLR